MHRVAALLVAGLAACSAAPPSVTPPPSTSGERGPYYADLVINITTGGQTQNCLAQGVPTCGANGTPQPGTCGMNPALGAPDGNAYALTPTSSIVLSFLCDTIVDVGQGPDFYIDGSTAGSAPAVQVSDDGTNFYYVNPWSVSSSTGIQKIPFELDVAMLATARFVMITNTGSSGDVQIDAIETVPVPQ